MSYQRSLRRQFDNALTELETRYKALNMASRKHANDSLEVYDAQRSYERARLVYLSCELGLRSDAVSRMLAPRSAKRVLVYSRTAVFRSSLAAVLRVHGYATTVASSLCELKTAQWRYPHCAVVAYMEPSLRKRSLFINGLKHAASPLPIVVLTNEPAEAIGWHRALAGYHAVSTTSIQFLTAELQHTVGVARAREVLPRLPSHVVR
jgi:CheY-like chemotaxis protein